MKSHIRYSFANSTILLYLFSFRKNRKTVTSMSRSLEFSTNLSFGARKIACVAGGTVVPRVTAFLAAEPPREIACQSRQLRKLQGKIISL